MSNAENKAADSVTAPETGYRLSPEYVREILNAAEAEDAERTQALLVPLHVADVAYLFDQVTSEQRQVLFRLLLPHQSLLNHPLRKINEK